MNLTKETEQLLVLYDKERHAKEELERKRKSGMDIDSVFNKIKVGDIATTKIDRAAPLLVLQKTDDNISLIYQSGEKLELDRDNAIFGELSIENPDEWDNLSFPGNIIK